MQKNINQMNTVFIHGYATNITHLFRPKPFDENTLFPAFIKANTKQNIYHFRWGKEGHFGFLESINPLTFIKLYFEEKVMSTDDDVLEELNVLINNKNPSLIITHSMGTLLLLNYYKKYLPNKNLKKLIFTQADIHFKQTLPKNILKKIKKREVELINYYCYWDEMLWISYLFNGYRPAGLVGLKKNILSNKLFLLGNERGLFHNSVLVSKRFSKHLKKQILELM